MATLFNIIYETGTGTINRTYTITVQEPNSILVVGFASTEDPGTFTFNSLNLTEAVSYQEVQIHYLVNPPIGAYTLASGALTIGYALWAFVLTESQVASAIGSPAQNEDVSLDITAAADSLVLDILWANTNVATDAGQTQIGTSQHVGAAYCGLSYKEASVGGTVNMLWTGGYGGWAHAGVAFNREALPSVVWW